MPRSAAQRAASARFFVVNTPKTNLDCVGETKVVEALVGKRLFFEPLRLTLEYRLSFRSKIDRYERGRNWDPSIHLENDRYELARNSNPSILSLDRRFVDSRNRGFRPPPGIVDSRNRRSGLALLLGVWIPPLSGAIVRPGSRDRARTDEGISRSI